MDTDGIVGILEVRHPPRMAPVPLLERWLRERARDVLLERVESLAPVVGVRPTSVSVRDQQTRWGSASKSGSLSFSWRLLLAPPFVLDAVVVHELAHLRHANHGAAFWALARTHAPRTDEARRWLRDQPDGAAVSPGLTAPVSRRGPGSDSGSRRAARSA